MMFVPPQYLHGGGGGGEGGEEREEGRWEEREEGRWEEREERRRCRERGITSCWVNKCSHPPGESRSWPSFLPYFLFSARDDCLKTSKYGLETAGDPPLMLPWFPYPYMVTLKPQLREHDHRMCSHLPVHHTPLPPPVL